jgi:Sulfatase/Domain of unknown function (DUF4976)
VSPACNEDHAPIPAPRDLGTFADEPLSRSPSFNEADVSDKPSDIRAHPSLNAVEVALVRYKYRCRLEALQHVDQGVARMIAALDQAGELEETLAIFVSDNGFLLGEHRIPMRKIYPYEESIRVPTLMRGPGVPAGARVSSSASNADLAPTILDAAGVEPDRLVDGTSLFDLLADDRPSRDLLLEHLFDKEGYTRYAGVRTERYKYIEYASGETELYDLHTDPYELDNRVADPAYRGPREWLQRRLGELRDCRGSSCRTHVGEPPPPLDLSSPPSSVVPAPPTAQPPAIDVTTPQTTLTRHPKKRMRTHRRHRRVTFAFKADEPATFRCRLDKRRWQACASPKRLRSPAGRHRFRVRAIDIAGNRDPSPASWRWRVKARRR